MSGRWVMLGLGLLARTVAFLPAPSLSFVDRSTMEKLGARATFRESHTKLEATDDGLNFASKGDHRAFLDEQGELPVGFSVGSTGFTFTPIEVAMQGTMNMTAIMLDKPTHNWAAVFTKNMFPGAPIIVGREMLASGKPLQGIFVNNKVSNVCPGGSGEAGVGDSWKLSQNVAELYGCDKDAVVLPGSTGVIGWRLPVDEMLKALPKVCDAMQRKSFAPAATSIMTTDRYPKLRGVRVGSKGGRIVGIAKGAGMIEPNMATMLVYILSDLTVPRDRLQASLKKAVDRTFNCISIDSDTSTSDTVVLVTSSEVPLPDTELDEFDAALEAVCRELAKDVVRNGEGTAHVMEVSVIGAPSEAVARSIGKEVVNSPLFKCAVAGNDPNVGRLLAVVGRVMGIMAPDADMSQTKLSFGGKVVFENGQFCINKEVENEIYRQLKDAEMLDKQGRHLPYPPHEGLVHIEVDLGLGDDSVVIWGSDLTDEYSRINSDYRS